jgi:hypothetical protein
MNEKIRYGVIGLVTLLAGFGGVIILNDAELDRAYYCPSKGTVGVFESVSKTGSTGYWTVDGVKKQATCTKSKWTPLKDYCAAQGIKNCARLEAHPAKDDVWQGIYWCTDTCDPVYP